MKKKVLRKKLTRFPSSLHMSNEGGEKENINLHPLPLNSKKNQPPSLPSPFNIYIYPEPLAPPP
jgi:hypothetical protein